MFVPFYFGHQQSQNVIPNEMTGLISTKFCRMLIGQFKMTSRVSNRMRLSC